MSTIINGRCGRCGTRIRNRRAVCPSCGLDLSSAQLVPPAAGEEPHAPATGSRRAVAAKAGMRICPICMATIPEEQLVDDEAGQKICPACAEAMRKKDVKKPK